MKFTSTLALTAALAAGASAKLHNYALCYYGPEHSAGYHEAATRAACAAYGKRANKGAAQWNTCPDCVITSSPPTCYSKEWHLGGDEINYYCKQAGAAGAFAS